MQEDGKHYLFVKRQKVYVSDEIYYGYVKPEDVQRKREERAQVDFSFTSFEGLSEKGFEIEDETPDVLTSLIENESHVEELVSLKVAIRKLSKRHRLVIQLYYYEGKTQQEIADILGITQQSVCELIGRILLRLKNFL